MTRLLSLVSIALALVSFGCVGCTPLEESESAGVAPGTIETLDINGVSVNFCWAPAGSFQMGSPDNEQGYNSDETLHKVTLTKGFWIAETETTQELWQAVMGSNPSRNPESGQLPVESVSWEDCHAFVEKLNKDYSDALPSGYKYALPSEAQWEYACRAGTSTPFSFGNSLNGDKANCDGTDPYGMDTKGEYLRHATPVKSYEPNAWGVYDMHGNVYEWCADWYGAYSTGSSGAKDPYGAFKGTKRVLRGGSWSRPPKNCRAATRGSSGLGGKAVDVGCRLALVSVAP